MTESPAERYQKLAAEGLNQVQIALACGVTKQAVHASLRRIAARLDDARATAHLAEYLKTLKINNPVLLNTSAVGFRRAAALVEGMTFQAKTFEPGLVVVRID